MGIIVRKGDQVRVSSLTGVPEPFLFAYHLLHHAEPPNSSRGLSACLRHFLLALSPFKMCLRFDFLTSSESRLGRFSACSVRCALLGMAAVASDGNRQGVLVNLSHTSSFLTGHPGLVQLCLLCCGCIRVPLTEPHQPQANSLTGCILRVVAASEGQTSHASSQKGFVGLAFGQILLATAS